MLLETLNLNLSVLTVFCFWRGGGSFCFLYQNCFNSLSPTWSSLLFSKLFCLLFQRCLFYCFILSLFTVSGLFCLMFQGCFVYCFRAVLFTVSRLFCLLFQGCYDAVTDWMKRNIWYMLGIGVGIIIFEVRFMKSTRFCSILEFFYYLLYIQSYCNLG